ALLEENYPAVHAVGRAAAPHRAPRVLEIGWKLDKDFDAILMDIKMPKMDGLKATTLIRQFNTTVPIVALTANAFNADKDAAMAAGCNHFMTKPIKKDELMDVLSRFCV
ncbi:MAG: response regulator, partial [Mucinivorans sp.]